MKIIIVCLAASVALTGCAENDGGMVAGMNDALARDACAEVEHTGEVIRSVLHRDDAIEQALVHAGEPVTVELAGPTSYVALEVPSHHTDYGVFTRPAGVVRATSTTTLHVEALNGACPERGVGEHRIHIHEFDHSVLTLVGSGRVSLYFAIAGVSGHGEDGGALRVSSPRETEAH